MCQRYIGKTSHLDPENWLPSDPKWLVVLLKFGCTLGGMDVSLWNQLSIDDPKASPQLA